MRQVDQLVATHRRCAAARSTTRHRLFVIFLIWALAAPIMWATPAPASTATAQDALDPTVQQLLTPLDAIDILEELPTEPQKALDQAIKKFASTLEVPAEPTTTLSQAKLPDPVAGRLALAVEALLVCHQATNQSERRTCATQLQDAAADLARTLPSPEEAAFSSFYVWPVIAVDADGKSNHYAHDFALQVDLGGDDTYANNAGGNLIDVKNGPSEPERASMGSSDGKGQPAKGCQAVSGGIEEGGNFPVPLIGDCVVSEALLLDLAGNDKYGVLETPDVAPPRPPELDDKLRETDPLIGDADCTKDKVVRRIVLQGAGFEGTGMLIDAQGNDIYTAKTASQGSGHVGGVGVLRDLAGNDRYLAIRSSQGFSLIGALGLLADDGGNDTHDFYMPAPKDPLAEFQKPGSGGVVDDTNQCDNLPRQLQGAALFGGMGVLVNRERGLQDLLPDQKVNDSYRAGGPARQEFATGPPSVKFHHTPSQGFGACGGVGILIERGKGNDTYVQLPAPDELATADTTEPRADGKDFPDVRNECVTLKVDAGNTAAPVVLPGVGLFSDDGSKNKT